MQISQFAITAKLHAAAVGKNPATAINELRIPELRLDVGGRYSFAQAEPVKIKGC